MVGIVNGGFFLLIIALGAAVYFTPLQAWLKQGALIKEQLALYGLAAPWLFTTAAAVLTAIGLPRLLLCSLGSMVFGFEWGLALTQASTVLGSYLTFLLVRWRGRDYVFEHFPRVRQFSQNAEGRGLLTVVLVRQLPITGFYNNLLLGLAPVNHGEFLLGSLLGFLPLGVTACLLGAGLIQADWLKGVQYVAMGLASSIVLGYLLNRLAKAKAGRHESN
jgi:uncharacterized membrane protein YdjX (TVP38/TMEM64 family)